MSAPTDMSKKSQNVNTSAQHINDIDMSIVKDNLMQSSKCLDREIEKFSEAIARNGFFLTRADVSNFKKAILKLLQEAERKGRVEENRMFINEISNEASTYSKHIMIDICRDRLASLADKETL